MKDVLPLTIQGESVFHPLSFIFYPLREEHSSVNVNVRSCDVITLITSE